jgi:protein-tyrosine-phosphatase
MALNQRRLIERQETRSEVGKVFPVKNSAVQSSNEQSLRKKVLFVCLGNACRSPMAESIARRDAGDVIEACSAGLTPLGFVPALTTQTLTANGHSIESLNSTPVTRDVWDAADIVINMSGVPKERAFMDYGKVEDWGVQDPYGTDPVLYRTIYEDIRRRVVKLAERLRDAALKDTPRELGSEVIGDGGE